MITPGVLFDVAKPNRLPQNHQRDDADPAAMQALLAMLLAQPTQAAPADLQKQPDGDMLRMLAQVQTTLAPHALLAQLQAIEQAAGRERPYRNAPRTLDLDILWFGDQVIDTPTLTVPHPRMAERAFVLRPLADLVPERVAAEALQAVTTQSIYPLADGRWAEGVVGGACS